jgi:Pyruvate/2-oxoacid:ferredoxin oxidoreductase delta subunit
LENVPDPRKRREIGRFSTRIENRIAKFTRTIIMENAPNARRVIEIRKSIIGPTEPKQRKIFAVRKASDYPHVPRAILELAKKLTHWKLMGPPMCDELIAFVEHVFTEEEASIARHLRPFSGQSAEKIAGAEHRPVEQVEPILRRLAFEKCVIASSGPDDKLKYAMIPIMPGIFEFSLMAQTPETMSDWHRKLAERFEALYETGYALEYQGALPPMVRFLPVNKFIDVHPMALPSDKMGVILDQYESFGVGNCQCRMTMQLHGHGCGKPIQNCLVMGQWAEQAIERGQVKQVSRKEALAIKHEAESHGMVNWLMNVASTKGQASCACCGCCCHAMRMVNEYNAPGMFAPPHFLPEFDAAKCTSCGKCAKQCPMGAITVDLEAKTLKHSVPRCIGCGLCAVVCESRKAVAMQPVPEYKMPYRSWFSYMFHGIPGMVRESWKTWRGTRWK